MEPSTKILLWSALLFFILVSAFKFGGKSALQSVLLLCGVLLLKDLISHFLGPIAVYATLAMIGVAAVVIWRSTRKTPPNKQE